MPTKGDKKKMCTFFQSRKFSNVKKGAHFFSSAQFIPNFIMSNKYRTRQKWLLKNIFGLMNIFRLKNFLLKYLFEGLKLILNS